MEANVVKPTTTIFAKSKSVEVLRPQTNTPGPANILQIIAISYRKISVPMYTLVATTMKNKINTQK